MLSLESQEWKNFGVFFGKSEDIPQMLKDWRSSIGTEKEEELWRDIFEIIWHQNSVETAAFAVVPHIVEKLKTVSGKRKIDYIVDLGFIEANRTIVWKKLFQKNFLMTIKIRLNKVKNTQLNVWN